MSAVLGSTASAAKTLRWAAGPLSFELASTDPRVLDRAQAVFGPWLNGSSDPASPDIRFSIEADEASHGGWWRVRRPGREPTIARSLDLALAAVEYGAIAALVEPESGVVALHAALLSRDESGVLVVGPKEAGKSTLACALWAAGWWIHSDDTALIEPDGRVRGIPRRVSLRKASRALLGPDLWDGILGLSGTTRTSAGVLFHPCETARETAPPVVDVAGILFLARRGATVGSGGLERLHGGRALLALAPYCSRREAGIGRALEDLRPLADLAPAFDLGRGDPATMVERVEEAVT